MKPFYVALFTLFLIYLPFGVNAQGVVSAPKKAKKQQTVASAKRTLKKQLTPQQMHTKGVEARNCSKYYEAENWFRKAAEQGHVESQYDLGLLYYWTGYGVETDYVESFKWFLKAAEQGHAHSMWLLGQQYEHGKGVAKDFVKAVEWYRKGAEKGDYDSKFDLGRMYENGIGVGKDLTEAKRWYQSARDLQYTNEAVRALERLEKVMP